MKIIYKYPLDIGNQQVAMHKGAELLTVQVQQGRLYLWALLDRAEPLEKRQIDVVGTGIPLIDSVDIMQYVATVQEGVFVWHVFDGGAEL